MNLADSETLENLKAAFAGESQANRRYLYFAKVADVEGYPDIAGNFRDTAEGELVMRTVILITSKRLATLLLGFQSVTPWKILLQQ